MCGSSAGSGAPSAFGFPVSGPSCIGAIRLDDQGRAVHIGARHLTWGNPPDMEDKILNLLKRPNYTPQNAVELRARLGLRRNQQRELEHVLARMERNGQIARIKQGNRYALPLAADLVPGRIRMNRAGVGFLQADDPKMPTIRISQDATSTAMHGDHVLVRLDVPPRVPRRQETAEATGRVVRVLERKRTQMVGTLQRGRQFLYVIPDDPRITQDIYVTAAARHRPTRASSGDKVVVELREWKSRHTNPEGEIIEVLGPPDAEGRGHALGHPPIRSAAALPEAGAARGAVLRPGGESPRARPGDTDCRAHQVVTIDPDDAKDFDDAICLQARGPRPMEAVGPHRRRVALREARHRAR